MIRWTLQDSVSTHSFLFPQIQWLLSYLVAVLTKYPTGEVSGGACPRVQGGKNVVEWEWGEIR